MRNRMTRVRVNETEERQIKDLASARGLSVSQLIRHATLSTRMPKRRFDRSHVALLARLLGELGRVGGNLNQLVRRAHNGKLVGHDAELDRTLAQIDMLRECIREVVL